jgi:predicted aminopeptidase
MLRLVVFVLACLCLHGCYYVQAATGQWEISRSRVPIVEVIEDEDTSRDLASRLQLVREARRFAVDELALPDNDSYTSYADIERDYVVWNVFAAPEFSLSPKTWCFPVVGCVSYRGYFSREDAEREAGRLRAQGYDVAVGGVTAYSTLGRFRDPVLSTMLRWDDARLVAVLFHELAHQVLYVKGDSGFNESFATAVEEAGLQRWLAARGLQDEMAAYEARRALRRDLMSLVAAARDELGRIYAADVDVGEKRARKAARLAALQQALAARLEEDGRDAGSWLAGELNNARLVPMILYEGRLDEFRELLAACRQDLPCFYAKARALAGS